MEHSLVIFISYKADNDSVVFNIDAYRNVVRHFLGLKTGRFIMPKEVIIYTPDYREELNNVDLLTRHCQDYIREQRLPGAASYKVLFFTSRIDNNIRNLHDEMEGIIERLSNSRDLYLLDTLNKYPEMYINSHTTFNRKGLNMAIGTLFPVGLFFWFRAWRFRIILYRDLKNVIKINELTKKYINKILNTPKHKENKDGQS